MDTNGFGVQACFQASVKHLTVTGEKAVPLRGWGVGERLQSLLPFHHQSYRVNIGDLDLVLGEGWRDGGTCLQCMHASEACLKQERAEHSPVQANTSSHREAWSGRASLPWSVPHSTKSPLSLTGFTHSGSAGTINS